MSSIATQLATVDFHGHALAVVTGPAGEHLVAMRPICEAIGLDWASQFTRIKRDEVLHSTVVVITTVAQDGKQREITCLPLEYLNGWLFGIDVARCREEIRPALIQYKRECYAALAAYWQQGEAVNPRKGRKPKALPGGLTLDQQEAIKGMVKARVEALPASKQGGAAIRCWSSLKSKFGCSYKEIPAEHFTEAVSLLARLPLEGELLEAEAPAARLKIDFPVSRWLAENPWLAKQQQFQGEGNLLITAGMLCGMDVLSPSMRLIGDLTRAGHNVEACRLEVMAMRHHLEVLSRAIGDIQHQCGSILQRGVRFRLT